MSEFEEKHLITRRRSLALFGSAGSGLLLAGATAGASPAVARSEGDDYVAAAASACTLTAEQEEGPYYVALERVREDIVGGQAGLPLALHITIINKLTCKPLKNAAIDVWHANGHGVYSDESSEDTVGETYLRGVQFTDKHGQVEFKTIYPGHYQGRTTHIHLKVHIGWQRSSDTIYGGHVAHTGQMFPPDAVNTEVYKLSPYSSETAAIVTQAHDDVYSGQHGYESKLKVKMAGNRLKKGLIASIVLSVDPKATPALIGATSSASGTTGTTGTGTTPGGTPPGGPPTS